MNHAYQMRFNMCGFLLKQKRKKERKNRFCSLLEFQIGGICRKFVLVLITQNSNGTQTSASMHHTNTPTTMQYSDKNISFTCLNMLVSSFTSFKFCWWKTTCRTHTRTAKKAQLKQNKNQTKRNERIIN